MTGTLQVATTGTVSGLANNQQINAVVAALAAANQGASAPTPGTTGLAATSGLFWHDTVHNIYYLRDQADTNWIPIGTIDEVNKVFIPFIGNQAPSAALAGASPVVSQSGGGIVYAGPISENKNRLVNGAMLIDQRNEGGAVAIATGTSRFIADQWQVAFVGAATGVTGQQIAIGGIPGFTRALKVTIGTGSATVNAGDGLSVLQNIEGLNVGDLGFGTAEAATVTVSFWVNCSIAGTFGYRLANGALNRSYARTFAIAAGQVNTWVPVSATIQGDTAGTWLATNGAGIQFLVALEAGANVQGATGAWQSGNITTSTSQTQLTATTGATIQITGAQLEVGPAATAFGYRPYATELSICQRYCRKTFPQGIAPAQNVGAPGAFMYQQVGAAGTGQPFGYTFPTMRIAPTITTYNPSNTNNQVRNLSNNNDCTGTSISIISDSGFFLNCTGASGSLQTGLLGIHFLLDAGL